MWLTALSASAQENTARQIYNQAEGEYAIGRIEQALDILQNMLDFTPTQISNDVELSEEFDNTSNDIDMPITIPSLSGTSSTSSEVLNSETVHSWQITFAGTEWIKGLNFEINGFYNKASNLIVTHILDYQNGGKNTTLGSECTQPLQHPLLPKRHEHEAGATERALDHGHNCLQILIE